MENWIIYKGEDRDETRRSYAMMGLREETFPDEDTARFPEPHPETHLSKAEDGSERYGQLAKSLFPVRRE